MDQPLLVGEDRGERKLRPKKSLRHGFQPSIADGHFDPVQDLLSFQMGQQSLDVQGAPLGLEHETQRLRSHPSGRPEQPGEMPESLQELA